MSRRSNARRRYRKWLDAVYEYMLERGGEWTADFLLNNIRTGRFQPRNLNSASQKLLRDKRFISRMPAHPNAGIGNVRSGATKPHYKVKMWRIRK